MRLCEIDEIDHSDEIQLSAFPMLVYHMKIIYELTFFHMFLSKQFTSTSLLIYIRIIIVIILTYYSSRTLAPVSCLSFENECFSESNLSIEVHVRKDEIIGFSFFVEEGTSIDNTIYSCLLSKLENNAPIVHLQNVQ